MGTLFALTLPGLLVLLVLFAFAETLWNRLTGGRALPWTRDVRLVRSRPRASKRLLPCFRVQAS